LESIGQSYLDRADFENRFDEIKNQWGWGGSSTQDIERWALSARAVAITHEARAQIKALADSGRRGLSHIQANTQHFPKPQRWFALVRSIGGKILTFASKPSPGLFALVASRAADHFGTKPVVASCFATGAAIRVLLKLGFPLAALLAIVAVVGLGTGGTQTPIYGFVANDNRANVCAAAVDRCRAAPGQRFSAASKSISTLAPFGSWLKSCQVPAPAWRRRS
jgi:hypothetical protein